MLPKIVLLSLLLSTAVHAHDLYKFDQTSSQQKFDYLIKTTRCVVCQNQSLADSNAPLAKDLRDKIYEMVSDQESIESIQAYLTQRYGRFILLKPPFDKATFFLWFFPLIALIIAFGFLFKSFCSAKRLQ